MGSFRYGAKGTPSYKVLSRIRGAGRSLRSDGRPHDTGLIRPYRPKPACFRDTYIRIGWDGIEEYYNTNWRVIRRWIEDEGRPSLIRARADHVESQRRAQREIRTRSLTAVKPVKREG